MSTDLTGLKDAALKDAAREVVQRHLPALYNLFPKERGERLRKGLSWNCRGNRFAIRYTPAEGITRDKLLVKLFRGDELSQKELQLLAIFHEAENLRQLILAAKPLDLSRRQNVNPWGDESLPDPFEPEPAPEPEAAPEPPPQGCQVFWQGWFSESWGGKAEYKEGIEVTLISSEASQTPSPQPQQPAARGWNG